MAQPVEFVPDRSKEPTYLERAWAVRILNTEVECIQISVTTVGETNLKQIEIFRW